MWHDAVRGPLVAWSALILLLAAELATTLLQVGTLSLPIGLGMVGVAAAAFMKPQMASSLSRIFVAAGIFWLLVLLGLGTMDPLTRTDYPAPTTTR
jgi:cytochrome c oxidase subunit IV